MQMTCTRGQMTTSPKAGDTNTWTDDSAAWSGDSSPNSGHSDPKSGESAKKSPLLKEEAHASEARGRPEHAAPGAAVHGDQRELAGVRRNIRELHTLIQPQLAAIALLTQCGRDD